MESTSTDIEIKCSDGFEMVAALSQPVNVSKKLPGIIVIHEAYGLNNQIRGVAKRYAEQGFVALAPNLFSRFGDVMSEKNIESAMCPLCSIPPEKRRDPNTIQDLMKTMSETDRKVMEIFFTGREELEKKLLNDLIS